MITITLRQILAADPCYDPIARYELEKLALDEPISFREIVERAGAQDAIWCFAAALPGHEALKRHFAVDCAERVRHLMQDSRSLEALEVARRHALGQATNEELATAEAAARAVESAWSAWNAAWNTAEEAAEAEAAWNAVESAWNAAWAAIKAAAWNTAAKEAAARAKAASAKAEAAEAQWQGQRLIALTEAGCWTPPERRR